MLWLLCKGRQMIEHTKKLVEDKFTMLGGYEHNAEVFCVDFYYLMVNNNPIKGYAGYICR